MDDIITASSAVDPTGVVAGALTVFAAPMLPVHSDLVRRRLARNTTVQDPEILDLIDLVESSELVPYIGLVDSSESEEEPDDSDDSEEELNVTRSELRHAEKRINKTETNLRFSARPSPDASASVGPQRCRGA